MLCVCACVCPRVPLVVMWRSWRINQMNLLYYNDLNSNKSVSCSCVYECVCVCVCCHVMLYSCIYVVVVVVVFGIHLFSQLAHT